jgi:hypothetical protein
MVTTEKAKAAKREYMRRWRAKNRERINQTETEYWERIADQMEEEKSLGGRDQAEKA